MSRHSVVGGDIAGLFACFADLRNKAQARRGRLGTASYSRKPLPKPNSLSFTEE
jgi:hypothetical protein